MLVTVFWYGPGYGSEYRPANNSASALQPSDPYQQSYSQASSLDSSKSQEMPLMMKENPQVRQLVLVVVGLEGKCC